jgi:hypothetical protein
MKEENEVVSIMKGKSILVDWEGGQFFLVETQGLKVYIMRWKDRYIYTNMHGIFFFEFPYLLYEWLKRKIDTNTSLRPLELVVSDQAIVYRLKSLDKKWNQSIELWFSWVKEGYIIEFVLEYIDPFSEDEETSRKVIGKYC